MSNTDAIIVEVNCPECGIFDLAVEHLWIVRTPSSQPDYFAFVCPDCAGEVRCPSTPEVIETLAGFVPVEESDIPVEVYEPHDGPPLGLDDLIDLMLEIERWGVLPPLWRPNRSAIP
jgi:predicted RNA-binding Zn-ribbon protein involved in translation (DUF1610 family)